jgi:type II secretory pathway component GspD/PulD (secretin)
LVVAVLVAVASAAARAAVLVVASAALVAVSAAARAVADSAAVRAAAVAALEAALAFKALFFMMPTFQGKRTMLLHPIKFSSFSTAALVLGAMSPSLWAQGTSPAITPTGEVPNPIGAAVPAPVSSAFPPAARPMIELKFKDVDVADLLGIISDQFDVQVVIASDVSGIRLASINLSNRTPEAAIQAVVSAAGLKYRKQADGTFLIGKTLLDEAPAITGVGTTPVPPNSFGTNGLPSGFGREAQGMGALPPLGGNANNDFDIQNLVGEGTSRSSRKRQHTLRVRNVSPSVMAYWLDPANNDLPIEFQVSEMNRDRYGDQAVARNALSPADQMAAQGGLSSSVSPSTFNSPAAFNPYTQRGNAEMRSNAQFGGGGNGNTGGRGGNTGGRGGGGRGAGGGVFQLPTGVDRIVAIDPQNALLVFGTDEGIRELQDTIAFLDRPLRQVEIEAQFITVSTADSRNFGIDFSTAQGNFNASNSGFASAPGQGSFQLGFVRGNFQATLTALLTKNRAKIITAPRVTAINNLTASLVSSESRPIILTTAVQGGGLNGGQAQGQNLIYITTSIGLTVTPTINNDDTITVLMQPQLQSQTILADIAAPLVTSQAVQTIANVRDGDTIALGGLRANTISRGGAKIPLIGDLPLIGKLFRSRSAIDNQSELIIFLTARIIRRAGDDDAVPGT